MGNPTLVGRSSSHYTRLARMFALELGVAHEFRAVLDLTTTDPVAYAGNPALKIPILIDAQGSLFGAENICRELVRRSGKSQVVMRGALQDRLVANAEELTLHVMTSEVTLIMAKFAGGAPPAKVVASIEGSLSWLDAQIDDILASLPAERTVSFLEVALYCLLEHLPFREILDVAPWSRLGAFVRQFGSGRPSAESTHYRFDA